jgi:transcriptional regulator with XRE-family HTH domain
VPPVGLAAQIAGHANPTVTLGHYTQAVRGGAAGGVYCIVSLAAIFGSNLRHHRKAKHLTQDRLAEMIELSSEMISKIERGIAAQSFATVEKLPGVLEVPEAAFFGVGLVLVSDNARTRQLSKIQTQLSRMNEDQLGRASKMLSALIDESHTTSADTSSALVDVVLAATAARQILPF